jgi:HEAT repeat protein
MSEELQLETQLARLESGDEEELAEAASALGLLGDPLATPYLLPLVSYGLGEVPEPWSQAPDDMQPSSTAAFARAGASAMVEQMEMRFASVLAL